MTVRWQGTVRSVDIAAMASAVANSASGYRPSEDPVHRINQIDAEQIGPEGVKYGHDTWEPVTRGKIDFLELFSGSAKLSQVAAMQGLRVGQPISPHRFRYSHCRWSPKDHGYHRVTATTGYSHGTDLRSMESDAKHQ